MVETNFWDVDAPAILVAFLAQGKSFRATCRIVSRYTGYSYPQVHGRLWRLKQKLSSISLGDLVDMESRITPERLYYIEHQRYPQCQLFGEMKTPSQQP